MDDWVWIQREGLPLTALRVMQSVIASMSLLKRAARGPSESAQVISYTGWFLEAKTLSSRLLMCYVKLDRIVGGFHKWGPSVDPNILYSLL